MCWCAVIYRLARFNNTIFAYFLSKGVFVKLCSYCINKNHLVRSSPIKFCSSLSNHRPSEVCVKSYYNSFK
uniref:Secreted protein n=1 Tax=Bird gammacoronavirus AnasCN24 TaxID=3237959 RepID=A0AB39AEJ1_9GAMC